jgi:hypothetical protein
VATVTLLAVLSLLGAQTALADSTATQEVTLSILPLSVAGTGLRVEPARADGPLDEVLPLNLPGVVDHGPLSATIGLRNTSAVFGGISSAVEFSTVDPLGWLRGSGVDERPFVRVETPTVLVGAGIV